MTFDLASFNAENVEPNAPRETIPPGEYLAIISESERKPAKSGNGDLLGLVLEIVDGPQSGRKVFVNLNLWNTSKAAEEMAVRDFSAICRAIGMHKPPSFEAMHDRPMTIRVGVEKRKDTGETQNRINGYSPAGAAPVGHAGASSAPATNSRPWERK